MKHRDIASGVFWLVIGLGLSIWTLTSYEIGSLTQPGTGYLPLALGIILILLSLILLIGQDEEGSRRRAGRASCSPFRRLEKGRLHGLGPGCCRLLF